MAGLTIRLKVKGKEPYMLGGVQKIEFERHTVSEDVNWDYILTTISDTRKFAYEDVEYIKVYGGAESPSDDELQRILEFSKEEDLRFEVARQQLRCLWTAYCLHKKIECDTLQYDVDLHWVWSNIIQNESCPWRDDEDDGYIGFDLFDDFMCACMV